MSQADRISSKLLDEIYETLSATYLSDAGAQHVVDELDHALRQAVEEALAMEEDDEEESSDLGYDEDEDEDELSELNVPTW